MFKLYGTDWTIGPCGAMSTVRYLGTVSAADFASALRIAKDLGAHSSYSAHRADGEVETAESWLIR